MIIFWLFQNVLRCLESLLSIAYLAYSSLNPLLLTVCACTWLSVCFTYMNQIDRSCYIFYYSILFIGYSWFHPYDTGSYFKTQNKFTSHSTQYNWLYFILIVLLVVLLLFENESQSVAMAYLRLNILILQTHEYWHYSLYHLTCLFHDLCSLIYLFIFFCILGTYWPLLPIGLFSSSQYPLQGRFMLLFPCSSGIHTSLALCELALMHGWKCEFISSPFHLVKENMTFCC